MSFCLGFGIVERDVKQKFLSEFKDTEMRSHQEQCIVEL